jgi:EAL domain-containing protein (putative c-di-GMP-specific phosphodiesterase class I)
VCQGVTRETAIEEIATNVRKAFAQPLKFGRREQALSPSIGVSVASRQRPATPIELISQADQAMYRAKRDRAGVRIFDEAQRREVLDRREVERALMPALAEGQFRVHYQPIVSVSRSRVVGLESLLRWMHPIHGIIGTERFLPVAEEAGMMGRLSDVVLRESAGQLSMWNERYGSAGGDGDGSGGPFDLTVGINMAERQLMDPTFPDHLSEILAWAGIQPNRLSLEIGEDLLLRRADEAASVLRRLAEIGVGLVVDDFGTSRTALARSRSLDLVSHLKIDRSLIAAMIRNDVARAVVESSVSMARALDLQVTAEGVETPEQRDMLEQFGIDRMQGFLFLRPLSADELEERGIIAGADLTGISSRA